MSPSIIFLIQKYRSPEKSQVEEIPALCRTQLRQVGQKFQRPLVSYALFTGTQRWFSPKYIENTFQATHSIFRPLEMHSKRRYKICICLVILEDLGFSIIFLKILDAIEAIAKVNSSLVCILNQNI